MFGTILTWLRDRVRDLRYLIFCHFTKIFSLLPTLVSFQKCQTYFVNQFKKITFFVLILVCNNMFTPLYKMNNCLSKLSTCILHKITELNKIGLNQLHPWSGAVSLRRTMWMFLLELLQIVPPGTVCQQYSDTFVTV